MIKKEKGITLVSLIITIVLMLIVSSTAIYVSLDRFEINNLNKMKNDIELLEDKVSNYYLKYGGLPVVRDNSNVPIQYANTNFNFEENGSDNNVYYILDLEAMEGISLNYGKEGFKNPNSSDDVYIINELTHVIYYVKGIKLDGERYHYLKTSVNLNDNIPPSSPQINVISGTQKTDEEGNVYYATDVEIEIIPGKDGASRVAGTKYSLDGGTTWNELGNTSNIYTLTEDGSYTIKAKSYDNASVPNYSEETELTFEIHNTLVLSTKSYVGYYANLDSDAEPEGIIYADLAHSVSGQWTNSNGTFSYTAITGTKDYYISQEDYAGKFGTKDVITVVPNSTGFDRFYVMALEDFTTDSYSTFYWYYWSYSYEISDYSTITSTDFGKGKENTSTMITKWNAKTYGSQDTRDIWGVIQDKVAEGWFVPSKGEWGAFGYNLGITKSNYSGYGLSNYYWSSSLATSYDEWYANFLNGFISYTENNGSPYWWRLSTTF